MFSRTTRLRLLTLFKRSTNFLKKKTMDKLYYSHRCVVKRTMKNIVFFSPKRLKIFENKQKKMNPVDNENIVFEYLLQQRIRLFGDNLR